MTEPRLAIEKLSAISLRDGNKPVLRRVSLTVGTGEVHGLVGESGAGKSTIAKAILGIIPSQVKITPGRIDFEGSDLLTLSASELRAVLGRDIALIAQDPSTALNPARRIDAQMTDGLRLKRGLSAKEARVRAHALLEEVQIRDPDRVLNSYPHQLSGGMRQRVLIAAAFGLEPKLVIADEPTTALDVTVQKQILRLIRDVERSGRLVGDDKFGLEPECRGNEHALAHAAGELMRIRVEHPFRIADLHLVKQGRGTLARCLRRQSPLQSQAVGHLRVDPARGIKRG